MTIAEHPEPPGPRPAAEATSDAEQPKVAGRTGVLVIVGLVTLLGLFGGWPMLVTVGAIAVMIFMHELGHFLTAKWAGMKVTEFFLGFGPRLWAFQRGETTYGLKLIPAGAYVKIIGMHNLDPVPEEEEERTYRSKPTWRRLSVAVAGSTMHFLMALVALWALLAFHGVPGGTFSGSAASAETSTNWIVGDVAAGSAAAQGGLEAGDRIVAIDQQPVRVFSDLRAQVEPNPGKLVTVALVRDGTPLQVKVTLGHRPEDASKGQLGVYASLPLVAEGVVAAVPDAFRAFGSVTLSTFDGVRSVFSPSGLTRLFDRVATNESSQGPVVDGSGSTRSGDNQPRPVSIIGAARGGADLTRAAGWAGTALILVLLNVFVGWFNLLPLLPLDGGHVVIALYEKVRSVLQGGTPYRADVAKMLPVAYATVGLLIFVGLSTMYLDVLDIFGKGS